MLALGFKRFIESESYLHTCNGGAATIVDLSLTAPGILSFIKMILDLTDWEKNRFFSERAINIESGAIIKAVN